ncbi:hypothetical protein Sarmat_00075 [Rickettsiales endosymbiont of Paramecium tredecaurelia]|uniref:hypothetical protein n=1 Tax=Candidatus Sarmatiella mevalonica TaxID=2770581 RepID=UPI00192310A8|nr:hypothetical protein [Candidatus Sarmatiella mevalonica]MBL3284236.1 hypothetical protein [Candidatus Sarmatiella mevalonica]
MQINPVNINQHQYQGNNVNQNNNININKTRYEQNKANNQNPLAKTVFVVVDEAVRILEILKKKIQHLDPSTFKEDIKNLVNAKDYNGAIAIFQAAKILHPQNVDYMEKLKQEYLSTNNFNIDNTFLFSSQYESFRCNFFLYCRAQQTNPNIEESAQRINQYQNWLYDRGSEFYDCLTAIQNNQGIANLDGEIIRFFQNYNQNEAMNMVVKMRDDQFLLEGHIAYDSSRSLCS